MNRAKKILEFVTPYDQTDRYGSRFGVAEQGSGMGYDIKTQVREHAMSILNVNFDKAEDFATKVAESIADADWLEIHIPGASVQWNRRGTMKGGKFQKVGG